MGFSAAFVVHRSDLRRSGDGRGRPVPIDVAGRRLTGAATIRRGHLPQLRGVVLRFEEQHDLFIAAMDGDWTIADGSAPPPHLIDRLGPRWREEIHVNPWIG